MRAVQNAFHMEIKGRQEWEKAKNCQKCNAKFTLLRPNHHCVGNINNDNNNNYKSSNCRISHLLILIDVVYHFLA